MKNIYKALANFQHEVPTIKKNAKGYGYSFADLEEITKVITPLMEQHGLGYTQLLDGTSIKTVLFHYESGETIESAVAIPQDVELKGQNTFQVMGSAITYLRRYSLSAMLGLVTDEDADAAGEQVSGSTLNPPTDKQLSLIRSLAASQGVPHDTLEARIAAIKTSKEASEAIAKLNELS